MRYNGGDALGPPMFTPIDKNLLIAALESAIYHACVNANVVSLQAIETGVSALRQRFDAVPENVSDEEIFLMVDTIERATIPALSHISAIDNDSNIVDRVVSYLWRNIVDKPVTFPPSTHQHAWSDVTYKPATFPPATHTHDAYALTTHSHAGLAADWESLANKPATFPPETHTHDAYALTGHEHTGMSVTWDNLSGKPATFPADDHQHVRQYLTLPLHVDGALSAGMVRSVILPPFVVSAQLRMLAIAMGNTGSASYSNFDLEIFDANLDAWVSYRSDSAYPLFAFAAGGYPKNSWGIASLIGVERVVLPKPELTSEDWLRVRVLQSAEGAADVAITMIFDATFEPFEL